MVKAIKVIRIAAFSFVLLSLVLLILSFYSIPDEIYAPDGNTSIPEGLFSISPVSENVTGEQRDDKRTINVRVELFNAIPVKNSLLRVEKRRYVVPSGRIFGLRLYTKGVVIVSTDKVDTAGGVRYPAKEAGLEKGDVILFIDSHEITNHTQVSELIAQSSGKTLRIVFERNKMRYETDFVPAFSNAQNKYMGGLWIRDSAAGIGTMTFYEKESGSFGGLGHPICDVDTGNALEISSGDIVSAVINSCRKGRSGEAGELCGSFTGETLGSLEENSVVGVYGKLTMPNANAAQLPVAVKSEVRQGKAKIISTIDGSGPCYYDIEIEQISPNDKEHRNMVIRVTDRTLLEKTGGIVQGMSGSPIIQNGMLVGAVTHVFVNEPERGYAVFAETMLEECENVSVNKQLAS